MTAAKPIEVALPLSAINLGLAALLEHGVIERVGRGRLGRHLLRFYRFLGRAGVYTRRKGLDPTRVGRDASRIADEVIAHLAGQVGAEVTVTLEIEASLADGASDQIVRTVTEKSRTLKFTSHGFESE